MKHLHCTIVIFIILFANSAIGQNPQDVCGVYRAKGKEHSGLVLFLEKDSTYVIELEGFGLVQSLFIKGRFRLTENGFIELWQKDVVYPKPIIFFEEFRMPWKDSLLVEFYDFENQSLSGITDYCLTRRRKMSCFAGDVLMWRDYGAKFKPREIIIATQWFEQYGLRYRIRDRKANYIKVYAHETAPFEFYALKFYYERFRIKNERIYLKRKDRFTDLNLILIKAK